ncbi:Cytochrome b [Modicisalibacter ilicicola DSM 19980]|uniref:Cytochrome b n=1 Tax=Modicisalibacter ilicicola DSM 19980 TaxID=1121942 RepID=A0A1M5CW04_9GAMM|nr:cytochrome b/b6 domain-containing protein [Halomonas ilicicola]SHF58944.1 Cytochrome b [Halomonas ilicicola DSM 19980]
MKRNDTIRVWDPLVRIFHWSLVAVFFTAYLTEGEPEWLHTWAGYIALMLLGVRILWGFIGTRHARFSDFVYAPSTTLRYLVDELVGRARRYLGHNPAGGLMALALILLVVATGLSGMVLYAADEGAGPLAGLIPVTEAWEEGAEEVHEVLANLTLGMIGLHVVGVIFSSLRHRENLVASMLHGFKRLGDERH